MLGRNISDLNRKDVQRQLKEFVLSEEQYGQPWEVGTIKRDPGLYITEKNPIWKAGLKLVEYAKGIYYIEGFFAISKCEITKEGMSYLLRSGYIEEQK